MMTTGNILASSIPAGRGPNAIGDGAINVVSVIRLIGNHCNHHEERDGIWFTKNQYFYRDTITRKVYLKRLKRGFSTLKIEEGYPAPDSNLKFIPLR